MKKEEAANSKLEQEKLQKLTEDLKTANETDRKNLELQIKKTEELEKNIADAKTKQDKLVQQFDDEKTKIK